MPTYTKHTWVPEAYSPTAAAYVRYATSVALVVLAGACELAGLPVHAIGLAVLAGYCWRSGTIHRDRMGDID